MSEKYTSARGSEPNKQTIEYIKRTLRENSKGGTKISADEARLILEKYDKIKKDLFAISSVELSQLASSLGMTSNQANLAKVIKKLRETAKEKYFVCDNGVAYSTDDGKSIDPKECELIKNHFMGVKEESAADNRAKEEAMVEQGKADKEKEQTILYGKEFNEESKKTTEGAEKEGKKGVAPAKTETKIQKSEKTKFEKSREGRAYNNIDTNSAYNFVQQLLDSNQLDYTNIMSIVSDDEQYVYNIPTDGRDYPSRQELDKKIADAKKTLEEYGYISGNAKYFSAEVRDLQKFMKDFMEEDAYSKMKNKTPLTIDEKQSFREKLSEKITKENGAIQVENAKKVDDLNPKDLDSILQNMADMGGVDQGQKPNGVLSAYNSKHYTGWLNRAFTNGTWAQNQSVSELDMYRELTSRIHSVDELKKLLTDLTGDASRVDKAFESGTDRVQLKSLLSDAARLGTIRASQSGTARGVAMTNAEFSKLIRGDIETEVIRLKILEVAIEKKHLEKFKGKVREDLKKKNNGEDVKGVTDADIQNLFSSVTTTFFSHPELYGGLNFIATDTETINRVVDQTGTLLSQTSTHTNTIDAKPVLMASFNLVSVSARASDNVSVSGGTSLSGILGIDGVGVPLSLGVGAGLTVKDNAPPLGPDSGTYKIGFGAGIGADIAKGGRFLPIVSMDTNWNDCIDGIERADFQFKGILKNLFDANGKLKASGINDTIGAIDKMGKTITDPLESKEFIQKTTELRMLRSNLLIFKDVLATTSDPAVKGQLVLLLIKSIIDEHKTHIMAQNSGTHVAGLRFGYMFLVNLPMIGMNFQQISASFVKSNDNEKEKKRRSREGERSTGNQEFQETSKEQIKEYENKGTILKNTDGTWTIKDSTFSTIKLQTDTDFVEVEQNKEGGDTVLTPQPGYGFGFGLETISEAGVMTTNLLVFPQLIKTTPKVEARSENMKLNDIDKSELIALGLSIQPTTPFERTNPLSIYKQVRYGRKMKHLSSLIHDFSRDPSVENAEKVKTELAKLAKFFGQANIDIITSKDQPFSIEKLRKFSDIFLRYSYGDGTIIGGETVIITKGQASKMQNVFAKEHKTIVDAGGNSTAITEALKPSEDQIAVGEKLERHHSTELFNAGTYSGMSSLVVATPLGGHHDIALFSENTNMYMYGMLVDIKPNNQLTRQFILDQSMSQVQQEYEKFNQMLGNLQLKISLEEYKAYLLSGALPANIKDDKRIHFGDVRFITYRAGFPGNECYNACFGLLYPSIGIEIPGITTQEGETNSVGYTTVYTPEGNMSEATIGATVVQSKEEYKTETSESTATPTSVTIIDDIGTPLPSANPTPTPDPAGTTF